MHKISTKQFGVMAVLLAMVLGACGGEGVTGGVTGPDPGLPPSEALAGTWRGGDGNIGLVWQLRQDGDRITGSSEIYGRGRTAAGGRVEGTVTGLDFTFSASHAVDTGSEAGCPTKLEGTLTVKPVAAPSPPPATWYYPGGPPPDEPTFEPTQMFGQVSGSDCVGSFVTTIRLARD